jgi:WD40 repeat protein
LVQTFRGHEQRITAVAVHEASELCVSGDYAGHIYAWSIASTRNSAPVATWQEHQDWRYSGVASLAISSDELLYSGSGDRTIKAWSTLVLR